eukprot:1912274-Amphidinium_carterae.1
MRMWFPSPPPPAYGSAGPNTRALRMTNLLVIVFVSTVNQPPRWQCPRSLEHHVCGSHMYPITTHTST